jgi:murein DD-endopeptidase MepM/ murein hydrolase activator NlpD
VSAVTGLRGLAVIILTALLLGAPGQPARAGGLILTGDAIQGGLMIGQVEPGTRVRFDANAVRVWPDGRFLVGFGRAAAPLSILDIRYPDGTDEQRQIDVAGRDYEVQKIDGLASNMVTPSAEERKRIHDENQWISKGRALHTGVPGFDSGFVWPLIGIVTGTYGTQRILNGEPRQPHYGVDVAAIEGAPVYASAAGVVVMAEPDLFYTGGTVMIDHGYGLTSLYSHLSRLDVSVGQTLGQGDLIGAAGSSGRATGVHLDWRVNLLTTRLDPALLVGPMPPQSGPEQ